MKLSGWLSAALIFCTSTLTLAQKKYQGLLWEISGNGLKTPSYLYGTMHVSNKLAFNVSDSFYVCLGRVEAVALESSPDKWMDEYRVMGSFNMPDYYGGASSFYQSAFSLRDAGNRDIYELLENENGLMNQILYRFNPGDEDYQENTYLDMFIFQAGAKAGKPVYSLENIKEVFELTIQAFKPDKEEKSDNDYNSYLDESSANQKYVSIEEAYRLGDLDLLDSLNQIGNPTSNYHRYFIIERNKNMVRRLDSLMQIQSVFTGIGAAHLPGDEGAIELLRKLGYTVRAVNPKSTNRSHKMREKMAELYKPISFVQNQTTDQAVTVFVPGELYEMPSGRRGKLEYLTPEPINGGYFAVTRLFTFGPLFNKSADDYMGRFDSLIYIATPGDIESKTVISHNGYKGFEITSKTSKNSIIAYRVFFTPTEIIIFKGSGNGKYIERPEPQAFFSKLNLSPLHSNWTEVSPAFGGAKWKMKGLVTSQDFIKGIDQAFNPLFQSYDPAGKNYYLVMRHNEQDLVYIEEDSFDLAYLGKMFAENMGYEVEASTKGTLQNTCFIEQKLKPNEKHPDLCKTITQRILAQGSKYYLMLTTATGDDARTFYNSFAFEAFTYEPRFEPYADSLLYYQVETVVKDETFDMTAIYRSLYQESADDEEDNSHEFKKEIHNHNLHETGELIYVEYKKFNDYDGIDSLPEFWDYQIELLLDGNTQAVARKKFGQSGNDLTLDFVLTDTGSARGILTHMQLHQNVLYTVQSLIDTTAGPSLYVGKFFETFTPMDTLLGRSLMEDKTAYFFKNVNGSDSTVRMSAMRSIEKIDFEKEHLDQLIALYNTYPYEKTNEFEYREAILESFYQIDDPRAYQFLEDVYLKNSFNANLQFAVLTCLSWNETETSAKLMKKLLLESTPFTDDYSKMNFFNDLYDSLEVTRSFFPDLLALTSYPEYKGRVIRLLANGYADSIYTLNQFLPEKQLLIREANVELKRTLSDQEKDEEKNTNSYQSNYVNHTTYNPDFNTSLVHYYILMTALKNEKDPGIAAFFEGIEKVEDKQFILETQIANHRLGLPLDTAKINAVAKDSEFMVWAHYRMEEYEMLDYFPAVSHQDFAFAYLYAKGYDPEKDSIVFLEKQTVSYGRVTGDIYFFKRKTEKMKNWMIDYVGVLPSENGNYTLPEVKYQKGIPVKTTQEEQKTMKKIHEQISLSNRKRVSFEDNWFASMFSGMFGE